jgi:hypothetical protein
MCTAVTDRMNQINGGLRDLCSELVNLQARALHRVEELENDFHGNAMLLTITNPKSHATDLRYLLHKNPNRLQSFLSRGHRCRPILRH